MENFKISVIVPIRITDFREDIFTRLNFCYRKEAQNIEYIVVDDGSSQEDAQKLQQKCAELGFKYIATEVVGSSPFNLARARNVGAQNASGKYVLFMDVDLLTYPGFYDDLFTEIILQDLKHNSDKFLMIPVVYLNKMGFEKYKSIDSKLQKHFANQILLEGKFDLIEKYSHGTSCILVDRLYYLSIGGQDERYEGWGYEDYDFTIKMMQLASLFPKPQNFESMAGNFMTIKHYSGWKAEYRLYGSYMGRKGIYLLHIKHEEDKKFRKNHDRNLQLLEKSLSSKLLHGSIQPIFKKQDKSLLLSKNPFCCHYKLNFILGEYEIFDVINIKSWNKIIEYFYNNNFTQIVFPNPYGNPILTKLYHYCREQHIQYIISERGALPGSVYHDKQGFLFDSTSYHSDKWDYPLNENEKIQIEQYLSTLGKGEETLESQPEKLTREQTITKLGINNKNQKKILIIFQTKNDTVIKVFGRNFKTQESLRIFFNKIVKITKDEYIFIYKNHPLEMSQIKVDGAINANDVHINDLIDICDAIITINSGAGLIAALLGKPVFTLGDCWYSLVGIACSVKDENDLIVKLKSFTPSKEKILRFAFYLRFKFYSFGKQSTVLHKKENTKINATLDIDYTEVQTSKYGRVFFKDTDYKIDFSSILFKEYESDSLMRKVTLKEKILHRIKKIKILKKLIKYLKYFLKKIVN